jgi:hypothetical protein
VSEKGGLVVFEYRKLVAAPTFVDYLRSGWQLSFSVAIDFTASNGVHTDPNSLHFPGPNNAYESAINCIGSILQHYG